MHKTPEVSGEGWVDMVEARSFFLKPINETDVRSYKVCSNKMNKTELCVWIALKLFFNFRHLNIFLFPIV